MELLSGNLFSNTLLEHITDEWIHINYYYKHCRPFMIGKKYDNYRELTLEESKMDSFKNLFFKDYIDGRVKYVGGNNFVCIMGMPLKAICEGKSYLIGTQQQYAGWNSVDMELILCTDERDYYTGFGSEFKDVNHHTMYVDTNDRLDYEFVELMVLEDFVFT